MFTRGGLLALALVCLFSADAIAQKKVRKPYRGINPGVTDTVYGKTNRTTRRTTLVTWVGFRMEGDQGRVFIQTNQPSQYTLAPGARDEVIVDLENSRLQSRNDGRSLDTSAFPTSVLSVKARQVSRRTTRVTIKLRTPGPYDMRQQGNYLFLDFRPPALLGGESTTLRTPQPATP
ncbi:MAG: AMIN domain-containing protein [Bradymonadia bacterium]